MLQTIAPLLALGYAAWLSFRAIRNPPIIIALFLGMYSLEQILFSLKLWTIPSWLFNVFIGALCFIAIIVAFLRGRRWLADGVISAALGALIVFSLISISWTKAPLAAEHALMGFIPEALLAFALGTTLLQKRNDVIELTIPTITLACLVAISVVLVGTPGLGGRVLIVEGGTVLSPAKFVGIALVIVLAADKRMLSWTAPTRMLVGVLLAVPLFILGARGQFLIALTLGVYGGYKSGVLGSLVCWAIGFCVFLAASMPFLGMLVVVPWIDGVAERYSWEMIIKALIVRWEMLSSCLSSDSPIFGNGLMAWGHFATGSDQYVYPHNSLGQAYYELGLVGLSLFMLLIVRPWQLIKKMHEANNETASGDRQTHALLALIIAFEFLSSLKQMTFMNVPAMFMAGAGIGAMHKSYWTNNRKRVSKRENILC